MQVKTIIAAAIVVACTLSTSPAIAAPEDQAIKKTAQPTVAVRVRVGQSRVSHRDARVCLNQASNPAIIKCAEKYRYR